MKRAIRMAAIAGALVLVLALGATAVLAQSGDDATADGTTTSGRLAGRVDSLLDTLAELLGIDRDEVVTQLEAGATPAEVAEQNGVSRETLVEELVAQARERIEAQVDSVWQPRPERMGGRHGVVSLSEVADALGMSTSDLMTALQNGDTIAGLAEANDVDLQPLVDGWLAEQEAELAEAVSAGRIDQAQADEMLAQMAEQVDAMLNGELPVGMDGHGRGHGGMRGGMPGGLAPETEDSGTTTPSSVDSTNS